ncbi:MAG: hypothetical protein RL662_221 [Bacteroidota bacterium]|jgi:hypothetical protein
MPKKLNNYLSDLRTNAKKYGSIDINGEIDNRFLYRHGKTIICAIISIIVIIFLKNGFSTTFIAYAGTILSILIGLFITALIFSFDKFYSSEKKNKYNVYPIKKDASKQYIIEEEEKDNISSTEKLLDIQAYNYTKQFSYITGYNIILCIYVLLLLAISSLFEGSMNINVFKSTLILDYKQIELENILLLLLSLFVIIQRFFVLYWILNVMYNTMFVVSSMVNFMTIKIDRKND